MPGPSAVVCSRLTYRFGTHTAVDHVDLRIEQGQTFGLLGPNGAGKTTTLRIAAGYETPDTGRVLVGDGRGAARDITREPPQRRGFGMVFQHYALFPHMRVEENVAFGLEIQGVPKAERLARSREILGVVGLEDVENAFPDQLSGGMQQRVGVARAFVGNPAVMLYDEPFSALDPLIRRDMQDEVMRLQAETGLGYRAGRLVTLGQDLAAQTPGWLLSLRTQPYAAAHAALSS